jgi:hypothetical protein
MGGLMALGSDAIELFPRLEGQGIDGRPGSIPLDLNYDPAPNESLGKYQLVTNFGTIEHVANQLNA